MPQERSRNLLDATAYSKLLKANVSRLVEADFLHTDMDVICQNYRNFLVDVAQQTQRVAKQPLRMGAQHAFEKSKASECEAFAEKIVRAVQYCNEKSKSATSCSKLAKGTADIVKILIRHRKNKEKERKSRTPKKSTKTMESTGSRKNKASQPKVSNFEPREECLKTLSAKKVNSVDMGHGSKKPSSNKTQSLVTPVKRKLIFDSPLNKGSLSTVLQAARMSPKKSKTEMDNSQSHVLPVAGSVFFDEVLGQDMVISPSGTARPAAQSASSSSGILTKPVSKSRNGSEQASLKPMKKPSASTTLVSSSSKPVQEAAVGKHRPCQEGKKAAEKNECGGSDALAYVQGTLSKLTLVTTKTSLPVRSYVQGVTSDGKRRLLGEFSSKHFNNHETMAKEFKATVEQGNLTYEKARSLKFEVVKKYELKKAKQN